VALACVGNASTTWRTAIRYAVYLLRASTVYSAFCLLTTEYCALRIKPAWRRCLAAVALTRYHRLVRDRRLASRLESRAKLNFSPLCFGHPPVELWRLWTAIDHFVQVPLLIASSCPPSTRRSTPRFATCSTWQAYWSRNQVSRGWVRQRGAHAGPLWAQPFVLGVLDWTADKGEFAK
jgi:hypothetical protein